MRPKLAPFPLAAKSIDALAYNENISALLVNALDRYGFVELIERKKIEAVIEQYGLRLDTVDRGQLRNVGAQAGFDFILTGVVGRNEGRLFIDLTLIGTHSQKEMYQWSYNFRDGEISSKLEEITAAIIPKIKEAQSSEPVVIPVKAPVVLSAPKDLQVTGSSRTIKLKWNQTGSENVSGYKIYRCTSPDGTYCQLANSPVNSYADENLELNDRFYYKVKALGKDGGESEVSGPVQGSTLVVPHPPVFMHIEPGVRSATMSWYQRPVSGGDAMLIPVQYRIYRSTADKNDYQQVTQLGIGTTAYTDSQLQEGSGYRYYVTALNASGGESEQSAILEVTTVGGVAEVTAVSGKIRKIPLSWQPHAFPGIEGYYVYRSAAKDGPYEKIGRIGSREATSFLDAVDSDNAVRWYRIAGINKDGSETMPGSAASATTRSIPAAPATPQVKSGQARRATVSWLPLGIPEDEKGGYRIFRGDQQQGPYQKIATVPENVTQYEDGSASLKDNSAYFYRVAAINVAGIEGEPSPAAKAVTKSRPEPVKEVSAKSGEVRKVSLNWQQTKEADLREFRVWRKLPGRDNYTLLAATRTAGHVDSGLGDGVTATYAVTVVDNDGLESDLSSRVAATTQPAPSPASGVRLQARDGLTGIVWGRNPEPNVKSYRIYRKGFLGSQKVTETSETEYIYSGKDKIELFVTAVNTDGLESEPSPLVTIESQAR